MVIRIDNRLLQIVGTLGAFAVLALVVFVIAYYLGTQNIAGDTVSASTECDNTQFGCGVIGQVTVDDQCQLSGWALDTDFATDALTVELINKDSVVITVIANQPNQSTNIFSDAGQSHGFTIDLNSLLDSKISYNLSLKARSTLNEGYLLFDSGAVMHTVNCTQGLNSPAQTGYPIGELELVDSIGEVSGWAYDPDTPSEAVELNVLVDGALGVGVPVEVISTDEFRIDVNDKFGISGYHGFSYLIPTQFRDGKRHKLFVYAVDTAGQATDSDSNFLLDQSPVAFTLQPGSLFICPPADVNGDKKLTVIDMSAFTAVMGKECTYQPINYDCGSADTNGDGKIDVVDLSLFSSYYGKDSCLSMR